MEKFKSVDEVLEFAIAKEEEACNFYNGLAGKMEVPGMAEVFRHLAREEQGHKEKLIKVKEGKLLIKAEQKVQDLKIGDYLADVEPSADMDYQEALIVAMKREKVSYRLYMDLAESADDENLKNTFTALANEEAKHKLRLEIIYDDQILSEN
ncbi:MAG: ferritin family protein [bacterium]